MSGLIPRKKDMILFGCWRGKKYRGNSRVLYNYFLQQDDNLQIYWVTKNREIINKLRDEEKPVVYAYSLKGFWLAIRAKYLMVTHGIQDMNEFVSRSSIMVNLDHSIYPIKDMRIHRPRNILSRLSLYAFNPFGYLRKPDIAITSSDFTKESTQYHYRIDSQKVYVLGTPKSDILYNLNKKMKKSDDTSIKILYLPTWRIDKSFDLFGHHFNKDTLNDFLKEINGRLYINFHPVMMKEEHKRFESERIIINRLTGQDINYKLYNYDCLITDYSAVFADFLVFDKPIIFANFSHEQYVKESRLFGNYDELPGVKAGDWNKLLECLNLLFKSGVDEYADVRNEMKEKIYDKFDGKACSRIYSSVVSLFS